jgi:hypothetical protein
VPDTPMVPLIGDDFNNTVFGPVKPPRQQPRNYTPTFASYTPIFGKRAQDTDSALAEDEMQERDSDERDSDESDEELLKDKRKRAAPKKRRCVLCCPIVLRTCTHTCHCAALNT